MRDAAQVDFDEMALLQQMVDVQTRVPGGSAANVIKGIAGISHLQSWKCAFVGKVRTTWVDI